MLLFHTQMVPTSSKGITSLPGLNTCRELMWVLRAQWLAPILATSPLTPPVPTQTGQTLSCRQMTPVPLSSSPVQTSPTTGSTTALLTMMLPLQLFLTGYFLEASAYSMWFCSQTLLDMSHAVIWDTQYISKELVTHLCMFENYVCHQNQPLIVPCAYCVSILRMHANFRPNHLNKSFPCVQLKHQPNTLEDPCSLVTYSTMYGL